MARLAFCRYKNPMARFCALAVIGLASLGVSVRVTAEEAPNTRVYHLDEYTAAAIQRYPSLRAAKADIAVFKVPCAVRPSMDQGFCHSFKKPFFLNAQVSANAAHL